MISYFSILLSDIFNQIPTMSPSQMSYWYDCPQKHYYAYEDQLKKSNENTFHMDRGTYFHRLSHYYYNLMKAGYRPGSKTLLAAMDKKMSEDRKLMTSEEVTLIATSQPVFLQFIEQRSPIIDGSITILDVEKEFYVLMQTPKGRFIWLHGFIDLVYRNLYNRIRIRDHKTSERSDSWSQNAVEFDNQLFMYNVAMSVLYGEEIEAVEINFINLAKKPQVRFAIFDVSHERMELDSYTNNLLKILDKILDKDVHRNYGKACNSCAFKKLCKLEAKGLPTASTISMLYERTNRGNKPGLIELRESPETVQGQPVGNETHKEFEFDLGNWRGSGN